MNIRTFESLKIRDYRLLWLGQLSTSMGQWMDQVSRLWLIYMLTRSAIDLGVVSALRGIPFLFFGIIAGAAVDRYGRKFQLVASQAVNVVLNIVLAILIMAKTVEPWHIFVTAFLAGVMQAFQQPARQVLITDLVDSKHLLNAISLHAAALNASRAVGPALAGLLIELWDVDVCYFVQAALYAFATVWTIQMRVPERASRARADGTKHPSLFASIGEGMRYIASEKMVLALIVLGLAPVVLGLPFISLMPIFAIDVYHGNATTQGSLLMMFGLGALAGALTMASLGQRQGSGKLLIGAAVGFGTCLSLFALSPFLPLAMFCVFAAGFLSSSYMTQNQTILQMTVPPEFRGRVMGVYLLDRGLLPLGSLVAGVLASLLGAPTTVAIMGASCVLLAIAVGMCRKDLWRLKLLPKAEPIEVRGRH